jgi:hypothetical protein
MQANPVYFAKIDAMLNLAANCCLVVFLDRIEMGRWSVLSETTTRPRHLIMGLGIATRTSQQCLGSGNNFQTWKTSRDNNLRLSGYGRDCERRP